MIDDTYAYIWSKLGGVLTNTFLNDLTLCRGYISMWFYAHLLWRFSVLMSSTQDLHDLLIM